jgi:lysophospholipase L1-like esterase
MRDVLRELNFFTESLSDFDAMIVQCGIVDCVRRPYPYWTYKILETLLPMERFRKLERFAHRRLLWVYGRPWLNKHAYRAAVTNLLEIVDANAPRLPVYFVPIATPTRKSLKDLPGVDRAAVEYNRILDEVVQLRSASHPCAVLQPFSSVDPLSITIEDGHHLSVEGHRLIASAVANALQHLPAVADHSTI